jgi:nucleotide-binding universal stress UspA family protein
MKSLLVCIDGSETSLRAVDQAKQWATAEIHLAYVGPISVLDITLTHLPMGGDDILPRQVEERLTLQGKAVLEGAQARLGETSAKVVTHLILGHPGEKLVELASQLHVDAIMVGSSKPGKIKFLMGSVSDYVVRHAAVPVIVIK